MPSKKKGGKQPQEPEVVEIPVGKGEEAAAAVKNITDLGSLVIGGGGIGGGLLDLSTLPVSLVKRLGAIEGFQKEYDGLYAAHMEELAALERKYVALYEPLFAKRYDVIAGVVDPAAAPAEEAAAAAAPETASAPQPTAGAAPPPPPGAAAPAPAETAVVVAPPAGPVVVGVPGFWLQAIKNHPDLGDLVTPADEEALGALQNVSFQYIGDMEGFRLVFKFGPNAFFENAELTKEYYLDSMLRGEPSLSNIEAGEINWKAGKNLTVKRIKKKSKRGKPVFKEVKTDSFFTFFADPSEQGLEDGEGGGEDEEEEENVYEKIHTDFSLGLVFKDQLIPNAYKWFTGEGEDGDFDGDEGDDEDDGDDGEEGEDGDDNEDDDDDDDDDDEAEGADSADVSKALNSAFNNGPKPEGGEKPADCKTQ